MMANELSATSSAGEAASGNFSLANMHFSTHNANNTSANHFDTTGSAKQSHADSQELIYNASYSQNMDHVMRAVSERSFRASIEDRILNIMKLSKKVLSHEYFIFRN